MNQNPSINRKIQNYQKFVKEHSPKTNLALQMGKAFLVGGIICCLGQFIMNTAQNNFSLSAEMEIPRLGVELELQLPAYTTATATGDPSFVCDLMATPDP